MLIPIVFVFLYFTKMSKDSGILLHNYVLIISTHTKINKPNAMSACNTSSTNQKYGY